MEPKEIVPVVAEVNEVRHFPKGVIVGDVWGGRSFTRAGDSGGSGSGLSLRFDLGPKCGVPSPAGVFPYFVEHPRPDPQQEVGSALAPSHLLPLHHPLAYNPIDR